MSTEQLALERKEVVMSTEQLALERKKGLAAGSAVIKLLFIILCASAGSNEGALRCYSSMLDIFAKANYVFSEHRVFVPVVLEGPMWRD